LGTVLCMLIVVSIYFLTVSNQCFGETEFWGDISHFLTSETISCISIKSQRNLRNLSDHASNTDRPTTPVNQNIFLTFLGASIITFCYPTIGEIWDMFRVALVIVLSVFI
jgi:hypothetical protein